jgi:transposase
MTRNGRVARRSFPPQLRRQIEQLACQAPAKLGWHLTHWSTRSLEQAARGQGIVTSIHYTTIGRILRTAELQPHRSRGWKTAVWDELAVARAIKILWYYEHLEALWHRSEIVIAIDEQPNLQVLERAAATQPMRAGQIERQEFEYLRHGIAHLLVGLHLHTGRMWAECLDQNDGAHFRPALRRLLHPYSWARRIHLILDNGPSHTSDETRSFFSQLAPRVHVLFTPTNASWLNQAELLLRAFSSRYLDRGSWTDRAAMIAHLLASRIEYNAYFAHPFDWDWTRRDFRYWLNNTPGLIRCRTSTTVH